ncbi:MAG TPA: hypothetical protein VI197_34180 [Polyangiaceae bacterium]
MRLPVAAGGDTAPLELTVASLCRLDDALVARVRAGQDLSKIALWALQLTLCAGALYGFVFGLWRAPEQALYSALKLPLLLLSIVAASAVMNGFLALVLRARIGIMQGLVAILLSMSVAAVLLAALAPVALLFVLGVPGPRHPTATPEELYRTAEYVLLFHTVVVGACGVAGNLRLFRLLQRLAPSPAIARRVFVSWLLVDGLVGTQLSWILRPFLCKPTLEPEFVRPDALAGNFFEELARILSPLGPFHMLWPTLLVAAGVTVGVWWFVRRKDSPRLERRALELGPYRSPAQDQQSTPDGRVSSP